MSADRLSRAARAVGPSTILKIAAEVRAMVAAGADVVNLTVGDFSPVEFPIPDALAAGVARAINDREWNYPPPNGIETLRKAVCAFAKRSTGVDYSLDATIVASGARPVIYAAYRTLVDAGDRVVYPVPSWNNDAYCDITGAVHVTVPCDAAAGFLPTREMLAPHLGSARLLALNSPLNPAGTAFEPERLAEICDLVLAENAERSKRNERPLYVLYDSVYWMIRVGGPPHADPVALRPEMAKYTVTVDAISKSFAATGLRVGWAFGPPDVIAAMGLLITHAGAWAPRAEQIATAEFLMDARAVDEYNARMRSAASNRLHALAAGLCAMKDKGLPVDCIKPDGAIYVSARFSLPGMNDEETRAYMLRSAGVAMIPFDAFGMPADSGWFRLSIGVVSVADIEKILPRIEAAISEVR